MSALANSYVPSVGRNSRDVLTATQEISRAAARATRYELGLEAISAIVLSVPGVWRIAIEPAPEELSALSFDRRGRSSRGPSGTAISKIKAAHWEWGSLRICFDLTSEIAASPVRFTQYVAQQIAGLFDRVALQQKREICLRQVANLRQRIETRKALSRASGLIAKRDNISLEAAAAQITSLARRCRRSLLLISQSLIFVDSNDRA